jgi:hypothetical protein
MPIEVDALMPRLIFDAKSCMVFFVCCFIPLGLPGVTDDLAEGAGSDEIQVYTDDINEPGQIGLEVHANYIIDGDPKPAYAGDIPSDHLFRITPEFSYGLTEALEAGLYLPMSLDRDSNFCLDGVKIRLKFIPSLGHDPFFAGANWELGRVAKRLDESRWNMELRPILGFRRSPWLVSFNPILGWALSGDEGSGWPTLEPALKVQFDISSGIGVGFEYFANLGRLDQIQPLHEEEHTLYAAVDISKGLLDLNLGLGYGLTESANKWTIKLIASIPIPSWNPTASPAAQ